LRFDATALAELGRGCETGQHPSRERGDRRTGLLDDVRHELVVEAEQSEQQMAGNDMVLVQLLGSPKRQLQ
jgi:hypothetical protein